MMRVSLLAMTLTWSFWANADLATRITLTPGSSQLIEAEQKHGVHVSCQGIDPELTKTLPFCRTVNAKDAECKEFINGKYLPYTVGGKAVEVVPSNSVYQVFIGDLNVGKCFTADQAQAHVRALIDARACK